MSIATAKVSIDKLVKLYEPLADAKQLLVDLEAAEQRLKEVMKLTSEENEIVGTLQKQKDKLQDDLAKLRQNHDTTVELTAQRVAEMMSQAQQDVKDIEAAGVAAKNAAAKAIAEAEFVKGQLDKSIEAKRKELAELENKISAQREAVRKLADAI